MQYHLSHVAFLQRSRRLLSARKDQAEALQLDQTIAALRSTIDGLNSLRSSHDAVANGAKELAALIATSVDLLKGLQDADKSQAFAKILVRVLQTILDNHSFDWGNMDGQKLLKVSTEHSTGPSV
ncbi:uncharacterized protein PHACADRAFT_102969 [Phanerochaete carnosa HHB-10118-sp]|uniref:Uncharacterized protein n=1 Tax=Phanerochaete carnosa (strain HHB-10118-sp) TaxID=650164 RepID=K5VWA9_PHACS|nr:uncharacterized protein PHACADRAFT_102969 [Phanerochaete carnosa HHB-10118-sp]EKM50869.1 hypothetical protein PHACADRAFT_102969 [Phanerochaete carnosa HHB-10118-sp]